jgi:hypothetical protein
MNTALAKPLRQATTDANRARERQNALYRRLHGRRAAVGGYATVGGPVETGLNIAVLGLAVVGGYVLYTTWKK